VGTGTGGTASGIGRYFKKMGARTKIIGVDPLGSVHYHYFKTGTLPTPYVYKVEGLGEDIKCEAFDPSVVDEMYQVNDYECFTTARRLTREEGIFCGGSSGGMVHIACRVAKQLGEGKSVIAICPDSGTRYVTKYLSDEWMKMHGFLEPVQGLGLIEDLLKKDSSVVTVSVTDPVSGVVEALRSEGISQVPVVDQGGKPVGMIHEVDVLRGLHTNTIAMSTKAEEVMNPIGGLLHPKARVEELYGIFETDHVAVVIDGSEIMGVVSKIDLIEHLAQVNAKG